MNAITNDVMFEMSGRMSIVADTTDNQLEILVETADEEYQKHIIGLSDNVSYVVQDVKTKDVSAYDYTINFNPKMWIPLEVKSVD
ncbi:beta-sandwich lipoprotein [Streptococcus suis]